MGGWLARVTLVGLKTNLGKIKVAKIPEFTPRLTTGSTDYVSPMQFPAVSYEVGYFCFSSRSCE